MLVFHLRKRIGLLLGLLVCLFLGLQFFSLHIESFERSGKDFQNQGLPTSNNPERLGTREGQARPMNLKSFGGRVINEAHKDASEDDDKNRTRQLPIETAPLEETQTFMVRTSPSRRFSRVSPAALQEEKCPSCYGTTLCDKFYAGNITLDMETPGYARDKGVFYGHMEGLRVVGKYLAKPSEFKRLDHFVCQNSSRRIRPNQSCDVSWDILHSHLARHAALDTKYIRNDAHKVAQKEPSSLSIASCASDRFLRQLKDLYGLNRWTRDSSPEMATLMTSLLLNPEGLLLKFFKQNVPELQKYFPTYLGECGRMVVVEGGGTLLGDYRNAPWDIRADLSRQIFQMIYDFQHASPDWLVVFPDFKYENFAVSQDGLIQVLDLERIMVVDKQEISQAEKQPPLKEPCNEECLVNFAQSLYQNGGKDCGLVPHYSQVMLLLACHQIISDLDATRYLRYFHQKEGKEEGRVLGGLLHDIPDELEPNISNLLYSCVFESKPGQRIQSGNILKRLLEATGRHLMRND